MRLVTMMLAALLAASAAQAAPLDTYSKLPSMRMPTISPDGSKVAFVQIVNGKQAVVIDQLNPAALLANIPPDDHVVQSMAWVDATHLAVLRVQAGLAIGIPATVGAAVVDVEKRKVTSLINKTELASFYSAPKVVTRDGKTVLFVAGGSLVNGFQVPTLELVDFATAKEERIARAHSQQNAEWGWDHDANLLYQAIYDQQSHVWTLQLRKGSDWVDAYTVKTLLDPPVVAGRTLDGKSLVVQQITEDRGLEFRSFSLADGKLGDLVPEYSGLKSVVYDPQTLLPIGGLKQGLEPNYVFFDPKDQALWDGILKVFPDEEVTLTSWSKDRGKAIVLVTGLRHGMTYEVVDTATHKAAGLGPAYEGITGNDLADTEIATYPAKDGLRVQAVLTLPVGREPKNLPLIVMPHGGPAAYDQIGYDGFVQAIASRGYAVLQPEFRGSSGLGWSLQSAGFGELGRKMQTDLSDGVKALANQGFIDPKKVCIVGSGGYSGYAALAGVMMEEGVYRCAVAVEPWIDMRKATGLRNTDVVGGFGQRDPLNSISLRYAERYVGAKDADDPILDKISPAKHVADASAPILIIHARFGTDDPTNMVNALKGARKPAELHLLPDIDTNDLNKSTRDMVQATVEFLEKHNPPK
jgi:dipeptidyl aminopeptidase/acylaminoacyl peptidase